jgi:hypothetical protein
MQMQGRLPAQGNGVAATIDDTFQVRWAYRRKPIVSRKKQDILTQFVGYTPTFRKLRIKDIAT